VLLAALTLAACQKRPKPPPPPDAPPAVFLRDSTLPPSTTVELVIGPLTDTTSADGTKIFVEGTLTNTGSRDTRNAKVWIRGIDAAGNVVAEGQAFPTPQGIPAGGTATFVVPLPNDPAIKRFHAAAVAR
jgi:hypothetical protein